ncbi:MAG: xanthine dehydrogenase small subunit [Aquincola sp.]|nr:xanthine dehydrogenase small subunit [Aquincola sp.]MDH4290442.1 xanthine dehydrogenase small subunit [Aquincola sp.]
MGGCVERPIRFVHRGRIVEVRGADTTRTLLDWLREDARDCGTKEGCAEGDCGACTVLVGDRQGAGVRWKNVNACIQLLPMLDGKAVLTVEGLKPAAQACGAALHPAQQAMIDCHGSQCGFCTPGFVMSMVHVYERDRAAPKAPSRQQVADDLAGNLCRCTGYRPILDAAQRMFELPAVVLPDAAIAQALDTLAVDPPLAYTDARGARCLVPRSADALAALYDAHPHARLLAGCTDIGLWVNKQHKALPLLIATTGIAELSRIEARADGTLVIGAAASLEAAWSALAARHPELAEMWLRFASPPVRHAGTMGGNVANGSPIGDGAPVLIALDASVVVQRGSRRRRVRLDAFYLDYMKNALEPGEFVREIEVPLPAHTHLRTYKLSKRFDSDISGLAAGLSLTLDAAGIVRDARLAFGGMAAIVKRAAHAEAALRGQPWTEAAADAAASALARDFTPITDLRASASYRQRAAANLLRRFWLETRRDTPLAPAQVSVFARETTA